MVNEEKRVGIFLQKQQNQQKQQKTSTFWRQYVQNTFITHFKLCPKFPNTCTTHSKRNYETYINKACMMTHLQVSWNNINIKPRFFIYPPCTHHFSFTRSAFPVAVTCWSLLAWRPPFAVPVVFPPLPPTWARLLMVLFLPIVFPPSFHLSGQVAGARFPSSPPVCGLNPVDGSASADIATIYPQFSPFPSLILVVLFCFSGKCTGL